MEYCDFSGAGNGKDGQRFTDKALEHLAKYCKSSLTNLDVSFCYKITDKGVGHLSSEAGKQVRDWGGAKGTIGTIGIILGTKEMNMRLIRSFGLLLTNAIILSQLASPSNAQFKKVVLWGDSQISDDFFDGHGRGESFVIEGIFMKRIDGGVVGEESKGGDSNKKPKKKRQ